MEVENLFLYIFGNVIFLVSTFILIRIYKFERNRWYFSYAYPSLGLLFISYIYLSFIFSGFLLWNFSSLGNIFRERFQYGYEYYSIAMFAGMLALIFTFLGYKSTYYRTKKKVNKNSLANKIHAYVILNYKYTFWISCFMFFLNIIFSNIMSDFSSVGYGDGNYAEKISDSKVKIIGLIIDIFNPSLLAMWYVSIYMNKKNYIIITSILNILVLIYSMSHASLFGMLGYILPIIFILLYKNQLPSTINENFLNTSPVKMKSIILYSIVLILVLLVNKAIMRSLINFNIQIDLFSIIYNIDLVVANYAMFEVLLVDALSDFLKEISGVDIVSLILTRHDQWVTPLYGASYLIIFQAFIPSLLMPNKTETTLATWYGNNYWFTPDELIKYGEGVQANIFYILGETFINFDVYAFLVIPIIFVFYGILLGIIMNKILYLNNMNIVFYVYIIKIATEVIMATTTIATVLSLLVKQIIITSLFFIFLLIIIILIKSIFKLSIK